MYLKNSSDEKEISRQYSFLKMRKHLEAARLGAELSYFKCRNEQLQITHKNLNTQVTLFTHTTPTNYDYQTDMDVRKRLKKKPPVC